LGSLTDGRRALNTGVWGEPPVKLAVRTGHGAYHFRCENEWPIARTRWTKLYLDLSKPDAESDGIAGTLAKVKPSVLGRRSYSASGASHAGHASPSSTSLAAGGGG